LFDAFAHCLQTQAKHEFGSTETKGRMLSDVRKTMHHMAMSRVSRQEVHCCALLDVVRVPAGRIPPVQSIRCVKSGMHCRVSPFRLTSEFR
jgi:hypothetical protein